MKRANVKSISFGVVCCLSLACGTAVPDAAEETGVSRQALTPISVSYPGNTVTLDAQPNDAMYLVNQVESIGSESTRLAASITHGGSLQGVSSGLDHIVLSVRGARLDGALSQLGLPLQTGNFIFGENARAAFDAGTLNLTNFMGLTSGRGITFWPAGSPNCPPGSPKPCALFENYSTNWENLAGLITSSSTPVDLNAGPFTVALVANDYDMTATVSQNGVQRLNLSCRASTWGDARCGAVAGDLGIADGFIAFVDDNRMAGRTVGATGIQLTHFVETSCPGCQPF
jgi:hypothetical protein